MAEPNNEMIDWRTLRATELQLKGQRFMVELDELQRKHGLILKAIIQPVPNTNMAQAVLTVELSDSLST